MTLTNLSSIFPWICLRSFSLRMVSFKISFKLLLVFIVGDMFSFSKDGALIECRHSPPLFYERELLVIGYDLIFTLGFGVWGWLEGGKIANNTSWLVASGESWDRLHLGKGTWSVRCWETSPLPLSVFRWRWRLLCQTHIRSSFSSKS